MPLPSNLQPSQIIGIVRRLGMVEILPAGEQAVYQHPRRTRLIALLHIHRPQETNDFLKQMDEIGIPRQEVEQAFSNL